MCSNYQAVTRADGLLSFFNVFRAAETGVQGRAIHAALKREHAYSGSYWAVVRMLRQLRGEQSPEVTVQLSSPPGEATHADFGAGPRADPPGRQAAAHLRDDDGAQPSPVHGVRLGPESQCQLGVAQPRATPPRSPCKLDHR